MATYPLRDKVVFLTGAGRGLGAQTARILTQRGARVVLADIDAAAAQRVAGTLPEGSALHLACDVTDLESVNIAVRQALGVYSRIDTVIANAGILGRTGTLRSLSTTDVSAVVDVNINGVINTLSATLDSVIANRGQVVVLSSVFAYLNGAGSIPYAMSKAAVEQIGRGLGVELAAHGASAMVAYFSLIDTDMIRDGVDNDPRAAALLHTLPKSFSTKISAHEAATALVNGIERRRRSVTVPAKWGRVAALRGIAGPIGDVAITRRTPFVRALLDLDQGPS
ncbi:SDR family NAD(P)-dependent oxidoreductase [Gordonia terrae]|uniref:SDR family NAD(P)-dependent oxidoreductase n=1 Tax=Gordonia terrae TaxID=2055 RepID=UPI003F6C0005